MQIMGEFGVETPKGAVVRSAADAREVFESHALGSGDVVMKAQCLTGGRGKGTFKNGFKGGVHIITNADEAEDYASKMLGQNLVSNAF